MAVDNDAPDSDGQQISPPTPPPPQAETSESSTAPQVPASPPQAEEDRTHLLSKARSFLISPQIAGRDLQSKRQFLREKGLNEMEIDTLLRDAPSPAPMIPPRTYPQPPPSNLPNLLLGLTRILSWITGGSALVIFIYYRFLLPRIAQSSMARHTLKKHHLNLMRQLTRSLSSFKESRAETWSVLPEGDLWRELPPCSKCSCIDDIKRSLDNREATYDTLSPVTVLRCGLADFTSEGNSPTTEELFRYLEAKIPWLLSGDGLTFEQRLGNVLSSCPLFVVTPALSPPGAGREIQSPSRWSYITPLPPDPSPVVKSLASLRLALPKNQMSKPSILQHTVRSLSDFTGYISTQVYMPYRPPTNGYNTGNSTGTIEDQLRKEIRALKSLVLNRRTFMPSLARPSAVPTTVTIS